MAFDVSALTAYVEENRADLIFKPILGSTTMRYFDVRSNVKNGEKIPILESTAPAQTGTTCGFTTSGTTTITQTTLSTSYIKVQEALCLKDLRTYYTQKYVNKGPGGAPDDTTIAAEIMNRKMAQIAQKVGQMLWQGKTTYTNDTYLKQMNGFLSLIDTAGTAVAATQQADITTSTVRGIFQDIVFQKMPLAIQGEEQMVFCGVDTLRILLQKFLEDNMYHIMPSAEDYKNNTFLYPGTNIKIIGLNELNANNSVDAGGALPTAVKDRIIAGAKGNFVAGYDISFEQDSFDMWYSKDNQQLRFSFEFNIGVVGHWYDQMVQYTNT